MTDKSHTFTDIVDRIWGAKTTTYRQSPKAMEKDQLKTIRPA